jgi:dihydroorotase
MLSPQYVAAKRNRARVTCEVTPHHFALTDADVHEYDANFKMNPPLRTGEDREALIVALSDGTVDAIATDHAPHARHEKIVEFERAAFGITGLETALGLATSILHVRTKSRWCGSWSCSRQVRRGWSICADAAPSCTAVMPT